MKFTLTIDMDNAAFDTPVAEVARILRDLAKRLDNGETETLTDATLRDINGNAVGVAQFVA
jgi:hypothetical protein